jgi:hypothetical protein
MSMPTEPPERLAEILLEILALSDSARPSQSGSIGGELTDNFEVRQVEEKSQRKAEEDNKPQKR